MEQNKNCYDTFQNNLRCPSHYQSYFLCVNSKCTQNCLICIQQNCDCLSQRHKKCKMIDAKQLFQNILSKRTTIHAQEAQKLFTIIHNYFNNLIENLSILRTKFELLMQNYGMTFTQMDFIQSVKTQNTFFLKSSTIIKLRKQQKIIYDLQSPLQNKKVAMQIQQQFKETMKLIQDKISLLYQQHIESQILSINQFVQFNNVTTNDLANRIRNLNKNTQNLRITRDSPAYQINSATIAAICQLKQLKRLHIIPAHDIPESDFNLLMISLDNLNEIKLYYAKNFKNDIYIGKSKNRKLKYAEIEDQLSQFQTFAPFKRLAIWQQQSFSNSRRQLTYKPYSQNAYVYFRNKSYDSFYQKYELLDSFTHLKKLTIQTDFQKAFQPIHNKYNDTYQKIYESLQNHVYLQELALTGVYFIFQMQRFTKSISLVKYLSLQKCVFYVQNISTKIIKNCQNIQKLKIIDCYGIYFQPIFIWNLSKLKVLILNIREKCHSLQKKDEINSIENLCCKNLTHLTFEGNQTMAVKKYFKRISLCQNLKYLDLGQSTLQKKNLQYFSSLKSLQTLIMSGEFQENIIEQRKALKEAFLNLKKLQNLCIAKKFIEFDEFEVFSQLFPMIKNAVINANFNLKGQQIQIEQMAKRIIENMKYLRKISIKFEKNEKFSQILLKQLQKNNVKVIYSFQLKN